jgi:hypothetical protein
MKIKLPNINKSLHLVFSCLLILLFAMLATTIVAGLGYYLSESPLDQYITGRYCDFLQLGNFSVAACTDGTTWSVAPWVP